MPDLGDREQVLARKGTEYRCTEREDPDPLVKAAKKRIRIATLSEVTS